jgi:hypothetical protein
VVEIVLKALLRTLPSLFAPSLRVKLFARGEYGFGHTALREPGDLRGTAIGRKGRYRLAIHARGGDA